MKEQHLTEGRGAGFPTIHEELKKNGSPSAIIDVDDEHTYFIIRIPCYSEFVCKELSMDKEGHILPVGEVWMPDAIDDVTDEVVVTDDVIGGGANNVTDGNTAEKRRAELLHLMRLTPKITMDNLVNILHVSRMTISRDINLLRANGKLRREGDDRSGRWGSNKVVKRGSV